MVSRLHIRRDQLTSCLGQIASLYIQLISAGAQKAGGRSSHSWSYSRTRIVVSGCETTEQSTSQRQGAITRVVKGGRVKASDLELKMMFSESAPFSVSIFSQQLRVHIALSI